MSNSSLNALHYHKLGCGPKTLLAFHGIAQDGLSCFKPFEAILGELYTIYAFDLFFHGNSVNASQTVITKDIWKDIVFDFLSTNSIHQCDVAGFSMGGRFALATLEAFPDQIENVFLIAPDGVSEHPLYSFATRFAPARGIFKWSMRHPDLFFNVADLLKKTGLIHGSLHRFVMQVLNTPEKRATIYNAWVNFRELRFDIPHLNRLALQKNIRIYLIVGQFDKLLKPDKVQKLTTLLPESQYVILKSGHTKLVEQAASWIYALFG